MPRSQVLEVIGEYLGVLRSGPGASEEALRRSLDRLALAVEPAPACSHDEEHPEPPDATHGEWRRIICAAFPEFGLYNAAWPVGSSPGAAAATIHDAVDDLADIAQDLQEVEFRWRSCPEDALFHFTFLYWAHWGAHLRNVQLYLHHRRRASEATEARSEAGSE